MSGSICWDRTTNLISAQVSLKSGGSDVGTLNIQWNDAKINAMATLTGTTQGAVLNAQRIAP